MMENGSLASSETLFCRLSVQSAADALLAFLSRAADKPTQAHWLDAARAEHAAPN
jgi:hypothetical protein